MISLADKYKVGSTWVFVLTRTNATTGAAIDLSYQTTRAMFRERSVNGAVLVTLVDGAGIEVVPAEGQVTLTVNAARTALFPPETKIFFDVEMTDGAGFVWQSDTYWFKTEQEVTRDDE